MNKIKYLHGSSYFSNGDADGDEWKDDDDEAAEWPATLSTMTRTERGAPAEMKYWF